MSDKASTTRPEKKVERPKGPQDAKTERPKGPLDAFRDLVGQWERGVNEFANEAMANEQFSRLMHGVTSTAAGARAGLGEAMERYLAREEGRLLRAERRGHGKGKAGHG